MNSSSNTGATVLVDYSKKARTPDLFFSNLITISGLSAAGTSSALKMLAKEFAKLPYRYASSGDVMRAEAARLHLTIEEFVELCESDPSYDRVCDQNVAILSAHNYGIFEGRVVHAHAIRGYHVNLVCPLEERAKRRYFQNQSNPKVPWQSQEEVLKGLERRDERDKHRFQKYPGIYWPDEDFDLVIDTLKNPEWEVKHLILEGHQSWLARMGRANRIIHGMCLPTNP